VGGRRRGGGGVGVGRNGRGDGEVSEQQRPAGPPRRYGGARHALVARGARRGRLAARRRRFGVYVGLTGCHCRRRRRLSVVPLLVLLVAVVRGRAARVAARDAPHAGRPQRGVERGERGRE